MGNFLVRETLVQEEFTEALIRLHEEKLGVSQADRDFGLPPVESWEESWDDHEWQDDGWWWYGENENDEDQREGNPGETDQAPGEREAQADGPEPSPPDDSRLPPRGATGSSPSHRDGQAGDVRDDTGSRGIPAPAEPAKPRPIDELSVADSFIMSVLRGWRLLQAAGLSAEEVRDILSSTRNSLDYETVSQALQGLWDEQLLGHRHRHQQSFQSMATVVEDHDVFYQEYPSDDWWDPESDWWDEHAYYTDWDDAGGWYGWDENEDLAYQVTSSEPPLDDEKLREAQQAEQVAEQLAVEAKRSWSEAQKATQALRRDRGFGAHAMSPGTRCFICNGPHMARDCPDRGSSSWKGRPKGLGKKGYYQHLEDYYIGKGKHKGPSTGKGKKGYWMESNAMGKKGKSKGKSKEPSSRSVNAYSSELFLGGLEVSEAMESTTAPSTSSVDPRKGMLDSGATASAAPEAVVKSLIETVLQCDRSARIELAQYARPFFRFGNGKWSKALGCTTLSSSVSGSLRSFSLYTLPNPSEYYSSHFDKSSLVPVLIGMDFLGPQGVGMIIDFGTGLAMNSKDASPQIYSLQTNKKGHYVLDIAQYLTQGCTNQEGQAHVVVHNSPQNNSQYSEHHMLELATAWFDMTATDHVSDEQLEVSRARIWELHQRSLELQRASPSAASAAQMCGTAAVPDPPTTSSSCSQLDGGDLDPSAVSDGWHGGAKAKGQTQGSTSRSGSSRVCGSTRSPGLQGDMALSWKPLPRSSGIQRPRTVGALLSVRPTSSVHPESGLPCPDHGDQEPRDGAPDAGGTTTPDAGAEAYSDNLSPHAAEDRCRGSAPDGHHGAHRYDGNDSGGGDTHDTYDDALTGDTHGFTRLCADVKQSRDHFGNQLDRDGKRPGQRPGSRVCPGVPGVTGTWKPCTNTVGKRVMTFATMMTAATSSMLLGLHLHDRDGLWEISASPHDWLSQAASQQGLKPRSINLQSGYDLYKPATWEHLRVLRQRHRPARIWFSLPFSRWCSWQEIDYGSPNGYERLETDRRKERRMLWQVNSFIKDIINEDPDIEIYYEWPHPSGGWKQHPMTDLSDFLDKKNIPWLSCRVDGCNYGLKNVEDNAFINKKWMIKTTDETFHKAFKAKVCPGNHQHCQASNGDKSKATYYPWRLVQAIARHWTDRLVPLRHHHLLARADDLPALCDLTEPSSEGELAKTYLMEASEVLDEAEEFDADMFGMTETDRLVSENLAREARLQQNFSFDALANVLETALTKVTKREGHQTRWSSGSRARLLLGGYSHGAFSGTTTETLKHRELVHYVNSFLRQHLPEQHWSSILLGMNSGTVPHKDHHNLQHSSNILVCTGNFTGGGLWIQGEGPGQPKRRQLSDGTNQTGHVNDTRHQILQFSPHRLHATEAWRGRRLSVSAYTTRLAPWMKEDDTRHLRQLGFPLPSTSVLLANPAEVRPPMTTTTSAEDHDQPQLPEGISKARVQVLGGPGVKIPQGGRTPHKPELGPDHQGRQPSRVESTGCT